MSIDVLSSLSFSRLVAKIADTVTSCAIIFMETAAQLSLGQTIFRFVDRFLWIVEKSAQWSLPSQEITAEENGKSFGKMELVRPLPWIFFLPVLILLRVLRVGLNIGSFILGYPKIEAIGMVKFLQKSRKRLRSIKSNGMKNMRQQKLCAKDNNESNMNDVKWRSAQLIKTIQMTLSSLSCLDGSKLSSSPPPTRIKVHMNRESTPTPEEQSTTESALSPTHDEAKRKYSELSSEDHLSENSEEETFMAKIDRLAITNSSTDDDYSPGELSSPDDDSTSVSCESSISVTEVREIQDGAKLSDTMQRVSAGVAQIIEEEPEPINHGSINQRTGEDEKFENTNNDCTPGNSEDFYSPFKLGEDGDTAFYSPISSSSPSPDRMVPIFKQGQQEWSTETSMQTTNACQNGEMNANVKQQISETTNGHAEEKRTARTNVPAKSGKPNHRGKRANHASRKKK